MDLATTPATADLCDVHGATVMVMPPGRFRAFGGVRRFHGLTRTLVVDRHSAPIESLIAERAGYSVLMVDGHGCLEVALIGERLVRLAAHCGWKGIIVHGAVRDVTACRTIAIGVLALAECPRRALPGGNGTRDADVWIANARIRNSDWLYADEDGIVISPRPLSAPPAA